MDNDDRIVKLINDDNEEMEFEILATFEVEDDEYAALLPLEGEEEVYLLKLVYDENGEVVLENIEDKDEFTDVAAAYEAIVDEII